jgi:preprotein translocase subunit YajC
MNLAQSSPIIMTVIFILIFYFLIIRPQKNREKKIREMRNNLNVGDNIVTIGGIYGKILNLKDDVLTIEIGADKVKLQIARWAVANLRKKESAE